MEWSPLATPSVNLYVPSFRGNTTIPRTSQAQWVTMSLLRLLQFRLEAAGEEDWWFRPPWNKDKDRPSVLDAERLMRRHRGEIQRFLSEWLGTAEKTEGAVA
jgi:hypothetical protein